MNNINANFNPTEQLNDLLNYLHDSEKGYRECARVIHTAALKPLLMAEADERMDMIRDLEMQMRLRGETPTESGSFAGPVHRLYLDFKALVTRGDADALLNEIKRGDNTLINTYKEVLREPLPLQLDQTLHSQLDHVEDTIKELDQLSI